MHNTCVAAPGPYNCGNLKRLAEEFKAYIPPQIQRNEIKEWWAKRGPVKGGDINDSFFGRGRFFESLARITKFKNWKWTMDISKTFKTIDFYIKDGTKNLVASLKTTKSSPSEWLNYNKKHLQELADLERLKKITDAGRTIDADEVWLFIAVPKEKLSEWSNFVLTPQNTGIANIGKIKVEVFSMDKALNL